MKIDQNASFKINIKSDERESLSTYDESQALKNQISHLKKSDRQELLQLGM